MDESVSASGLSATHPCLKAATTKVLHENPGKEPAVKSQGLSREHDQVKVFPPECKSQTQNQVSPSSNQQRAMNAAKQNHMSPQEK